LASTFRTKTVPLLRLRPPFRILQTAACWQWMSCLKTQIPAGLRPLLLNLDEARPTWFYGGGKCTARMRRRACSSRPLPTQRATKAQLRSGLTHAVLVRDRTGAQAAPPQVFTHSAHFPTLRILRAVAAERSPNVFFVRRRSSLPSAGDLCDILRRFRDAGRCGFALGSRWGWAGRGRSLRASQSRQADCVFIWPRPHY